MLEQGSNCNIQNSSYVIYLYGDTKNYIAHSCGLILTLNNPT